MIFIRDLALFLLKEFQTWKKHQNCSKFVAQKDEKQKGTTTSTKYGKLITMIAAVNTTGNHVTPLLVIPRAKFRDFVITGAPPGTTGETTPSGWSNEEVFLTFLTHFMSHTKP
jgi:hypothetical protein